MVGMPHPPPPESNENKKEQKQTKQKQSTETKAKTRAVEEGKGRLQKALSDALELLGETAFGQRALHADERHQRQHTVSAGVGGMKAL